MLFKCAYGHVIDCEFDYDIEVAVIVCEHCKRERGKMVWASVTTLNKEERRMLSFLNEEELCCYLEK